jgi:hypothetical protein
MLPIVSDYKFASKERGYKPNNVKVAGAAACGTRRVAALAGGTLAAGTRHSAKDVFVLALSGNENKVAASADYQKAMQDAMKCQGRKSGLWSTPSKCRGLGWAGRQHKQLSG